MPGSRGASVVWIQTMIKDDGAGATLCQLDLSIIESCKARAPLQEGLCCQVW
jgi:predicted 2-oxoglutarate/Fe(II)-dependent dioxygenase YbiX